MKILLLLLPACCCMYSALSQNPTFITVKAGSSIEEAVSDSDLYEYPKFVNGTVVFKDGTNSSAAMNYNRFLDEMQFVDPKGDTMAIANERTIQFINVNSDSFFYDKGYLKLIEGNRSAKLAEKKVIKVADKKKIGGYDMASSSSAIESYQSYNDGRQFYNLNVRQDVMLEKLAQYYLGDKYNHFVVANKRNLFDLFSKQQAAVKTYLKENPVDFSSREDLQKLVQFLGQL